MTGWGFDTFPLYNVFFKLLRDNWQHEEASLILPAIRLYYFLRFLLIQFFLLFPVNESHFLDSISYFAWKFHSKTSHQGIILLREHRRKSYLHILFDRSQVTFQQGWAQLIRHDQMLPVLESNHHISVWSKYKNLEYKISTFCSHTSVLRQACTFWSWR